MRGKARQGIPWTVVVKKSIYYPYNSCRVGHGEDRAAAFEFDLAIFSPLIKLEAILNIVKEGGYDHKVNETVNVVTAKTTEIGNRTWGMMKGVMAMASQKVEEYTKEGWNNDNWQRNDSQSNGYYQEFNKQENKGWNSSPGGQSSSGHHNSYNSSSWDDWDQKDNRKEDSIKSPASHSSDGWAGWDDAKDDGYDDNFHHSTPSKESASHNGKSDASWTGEAFFSSRTDAWQAATMTEVMNMNLHYGAAD
ncbi:unnamed protein product [Dovyalis caffra]|uniref:ADP-ribosylation factor GTPase-activating protein AGD6 n=1 Tax=Dovyalis caffra TaxID=77055 RepID=A0AAV1RGE7_9ROSI|nr:unnamed protein product [Dovyalis caffra]